MQTYIMDMLEKLIAIDSTTGDCDRVEEFIANQINAMGFPTKHLNKGGLTADLGGEGDTIAVLAHMDDIGFMVRYINGDGSLKLVTVGGLPTWTSEEADARVYTRSGKVYTGTVRRRQNCLHIMSPAQRTLPNGAEAYNHDLALYLDEDVSSAREVRELGIECGDFIALEPHYSVTPNGYIKSRYLDNKACVAVLLGYIKALSLSGKAPKRHVVAHFAAYEEIGHGGSCGIPQDATEVLGLDIACCGIEQYSDEKKVSICAKDARFPYNKHMVEKLSSAAEKNGLNYAIDMYTASYGSDANAALTAGYDVRHGLIGPGVLSSHGYERTHTEGVMNTYKLLCAYLDM